MEHKSLIYKYFGTEKYEENANLSTDEDIITWSSEQIAEGKANQKEAQAVFREICDLLKDGYWKPCIHTEIRTYSFCLTHFNFPISIYISVQPFCVKITSTLDKFPNMDYFREHAYMTLSNINEELSFGAVYVSGEYYDEIEFRCCYIYPKNGFSIESFDGFMMTTLISIRDCTKVITNAHSMALLTAPDYIVDEFEKRKEGAKRLIRSIYDFLEMEKRRIISSDFENASCTFEWEEWDNTYLVKITLDSEIECVKYTITPPDDLNLNDFKEQQELLLAARANFNVELNDDGKLVFYASCQYSRMYFSSESTFGYLRTCLREIGLKTAELINRIRYE